ncbi:MAG: 3-deoxy-manno-octulosonate cytidylyltransferase [Bacteroidetes bacterium HGW-Bacteroidetes-6]|jgi:3-deoxy-manno-octulosonate cytidylyltransferase (CMP-KDO synthetase)|nr:MAG: 3-deoxy-manno-octulosonate cytidylyltransferase [Bacteroidetes bacterium HGW-Bacteroidetes-6]
MQIIGIIPARYASTRFHGKPLALIAGKAMIQWVYENASGAKSLSQLFVATDDSRIAEKVAFFGGRSVMTSEDHMSGTDRCFEAANIAGARPDDSDTIIINIQGDEPFIEPEIIDKIATAFSDPSVNIATLVRPFDNDEDLFSETCMKVVINKTGNALYFSRSIVPFVRNRRTDKPMFEQFPFKQHIGIYAYRMSTLAQLTRLGPSLLEKTESLEQLRWLENGYSIRVLETTYKGHSVDVPSDIDKLKNSFPDVFRSSFQ